MKRPPPIGSRWKCGQDILTVTRVFQKNNQCWVGYNSNKNGTIGTCGEIDFVFWCELDMKQMETGLERAIKKVSRAS